VRTESAAASERIPRPTHPAAPEMTVQEGFPQDTVYNFTLDSKDRKF
jgi:hypothetical protein